ncbi:hypothetical protein [Flavobacterium rhizosphaerae]|uniref:Uncharacterized protein n=1 Tax=Flavobacterium rhizosphaerae TaxID=3163298 RepID=A0ABW8YYT2_9FLAO
MEPVIDTPIGKKENYLVIARVLFISFFIASLLIIVLNLNFIDIYMDIYFGNLKSELLKQFLYGSLGATIACSIFLSKDKEINELESLKSNPNYEILRYPTKEDIHLYIQRIISSGILGVVGVLVLLAGFGYLDISPEKINMKHKILFALSSFLIGVFQSKFYDNLQSIMENIFKKK